MKPGVEAYLASLPECKLSDKEIINLLDLLVKGYRAMLVQWEFLTLEVLKTRIDDKELHDIIKKAIKWDERFTGYEEELEGMRKYLSSTLKEMASKGSQENYTIEGDVSNVSIVDQCL